MGKIIITNIRNIAAKTADEKYAIVRSYKNPVPGVEQLAVLSPSYSLFGRYMELRNAGQWNAATYAGIYVPAFLQEMASPQAVRTLEGIAASEKTVALACFCADEALCHRLVVGSILRGLGCGVEMRTPPVDAYYRQWLALRGK